MGPSDSSALPAEGEAGVPAHSGERMGILVVGMHRSGTSAVTRMLSLLGADLPRHVMPPRRGNEAGHWEPERIADLHDEIFESANTSLYDVAPFPRGWNESAAEPRFRRRMVSLVQEEYGDSPLFVLKDPRLSRLIPFWLTTLETLRIAPAFVLCVRNPLESARSLADRDGQSIQRALLMWLRYTLEAERETRAHPRVIVSYQQLLGDWESVATTIADALEISWPRLSNRTRAEIGRFIESSHRHYDVSDIELAESAAVVSWVKSAYAELSRAAKAHEAPDGRLLDEIARLADDADRAYGPIIGGMELDLAEAEREREAARRDLELAAEEVAALERKARTASSELGVARSGLQTARSELHARSSELDTARSELDTARSELNTARSELSSTHAELGSARSDLATAHAELSAGRSALESALRELDTRSGEVARLKRSLETVREEIGASLVGARPAGWWRSRSQFLGWLVRGRFHEAREAVRLKRSGQFDPNLYLARYPDVLAMRLNPLLHYVAHGAWEGRDPTRGFSSADYLASHPQLLETRENPFLHHLRTGQEAVPGAAGTAASTFLEPVPRSGKTPRWRSARTLAGWVVRGRFDDIRTYRALKRSGHFDAAYYLSSYADIREQKANPLMHYVAAGARECRDPSRVFRTNDYLVAYPELAETGENPLLHWVRNGGPDGAASSAPSAPGPQPQAAAPQGARSRRKAREAAEIAAISRDIVASGGSPLVLRTAGESIPSEARPYPAAEDGSDPGARGSTAAIANLEAQRAAGATHLIVPSAGEAWLAERAEAKTHLQGRFPLAGGRSCGVYSVESAQVSLARAVQEFCESYRWRYGARPSILDMTGSIAREGIVTSTVVFEPSGAGPNGELPYLDSSIDAVIAADGITPAELHEAQRIAGSAVAMASTEPGSDVPLSVEWLRDREAPAATVSLVIPSYNGAKLLGNCLRTLAETIPADIEVEVVISDDASTDDTEVVAGSFREALNLSLVKAERNSGFVSACNRGAQASSGDILVFLNNDTLALPGWLSALGCAIRDEGAGAAGGKLVFGDGRLQEAGGVIFDDASGANFGRNAPDPDAPLFETRRRVHYVSGALLATPAELFRELGGFGPEYAPGYYEDTDYCFRIRERGMPVVYEPRATVVHLEGGTAGTSEARGMKRYQAINRDRFRERWAKVLSTHPKPPSRWDDQTWHRLAKAGR